MVHVTCDLCGKKLRPGEDQRYVVKIEAYPVEDPAQITDDDLDLDHMEAVSQMLQECEDNASDLELVEPYKSFRYDLCSQCHEKFIRDPMARDRESKFQFSKN